MVSPVLNIVANVYEIYYIDCDYRVILCDTNAQNYNSGDNRTLVYVLLVYHKITQTKAYGWNIILLILENDGMKWDDETAKKI